MMILESCACCPSGALICFSSLNCFHKDYKSMTQIYKLLENYHQLYQCDGCYIDVRRVKLGLR